MKRRIIICVAVLLAVSCCIIVFAMKSSKIVGYDGVIAKARKEIKNIAEIDTLEMVIAGKPTVDRKITCFGLLRGTNIRCTDISRWNLLSLKTMNINLCINIMGFKGVRIFLCRSGRAVIRL